MSTKLPFKSKQLQNKYSWFMDSKIANKLTTALKCQTSKNVSLKYF